MLDKNKLPLSIPLLDEGFIELQDFMGDDNAIVAAARVSFLGESKGEAQDKKLISYLIKHQHTTPFEQVMFKFRVKCPLFVARQWMRHRTWCLTGDTEITFNRPDRWARGIHTKQTGNKGQSFTLERLYRLWNTPCHHKRIKNMLLRVYDEKNAVFTVSHIKDVLYSGVKEVFEVTLEDGKTLKCSKDHQLLTANGWQRLEEAVGLEVTKNGTATMSKDCHLTVNGTTDLWRSYDWMSTHRKEGLSVQQIADKAGCSYHTIRKWLKLHESFQNFDNPTMVCENYYVDIHKNDEMAGTRKSSPLVSQYKKVIGIKFLGKQETYDLEVEGEHHNFVANGIVVHNSFNEVSRRYSSESLDFYMPTEWRVQHEKSKQCSDGNAEDNIQGQCIQDLTDIVDKSMHVYNTMIDEGIAREMARMILPQNMYTLFIGTIDAHNLLHFLKLRRDEHAQYEIRVYADAIWEHFFKPVLPWTAAAVEKHIFEE